MADKERVTSLFIGESPTLYPASVVAALCGIDADNCFYNILLSYDISTLTV